MHLLYYLSVMGALFSPCFAYTINWSGSQPRCRLSQGRIQSIYNIIEPAMADTAVFSQGQTIACSDLGWNGLRGSNNHWGYCAWIGHGGGNVFNRAKILSLLENLLQPPNSGKSCGSVPIDYPLLNNSYNELTVNYVYSMPCIGYCSNNQDKQHTLPNNERGYAPGTCQLKFMQYQGFVGSSDAPTYIKTGLPATTHMDIQIVDANGLLIGETWFQESPAGQTWDLPSQLPAMLLVGLGMAQSDAIDFAYNGAEFSTSSSQCSLSGDFENGARFGSCNFPCVEDTTTVSRVVNGTVNRYVNRPVNGSVNGFFQHTKFYLSYSPVSSLNITCSYRKQRLLLMLSQSRLNISRLSRQMGSHFACVVSSNMTLSTPRPLRLQVRKGEPGLGRCRPIRFGCCKVSFTGRTAGRNRKKPPMCGSWTLVGIVCWQNCVGKRFGSEYGVGMVVCSMRKVAVS